MIDLTQIRKAFKSSFTLVFLFFALYSAKNFSGSTEFGISTKNFFSYLCTPNKKS